MAQNNSTPEPIQISAVSFTIPPFWTHNPELWFIQAESYFELKRITQDKIKVHYVTSSLGQDSLPLVQDILIKGTYTYDELKQALTSRLAETERRRIQRLLTQEELGDRTPSQLLRSMQALVPNKAFDHSLLKQLFLQRLPLHVQQILASTSDSIELSDLANLADKIMEVQPPASLTTTTTNLSVCELATAIKNLELRLNNLTRKSPKRSRSTSSSRGFCWYHTKFGKKAKKCTKPCAFKNQGNRRASP